MDFIISLFIAAVIAGTFVYVMNQINDRDNKIAFLEKRLDQAKGRVEELEREVEKMKDY